MVRRQSTVVRHRRPSLTATIDRRSPSLIATVDRWPVALTVVDRWRLDELKDDTSDGTVAAEKSSTRLRVQYEVQRVQKKAIQGTVAVQGSERKSILEADVAQCDWWIKNITAAMKNDQNTLRSRFLIGWSLGLTKIPPTPFGL
nr:hypothetical protein [Tanacetum cinerariifolium]